MSANAELSVAIIGCGAIAGGYDEGKPKEADGVFSHAGAYRAAGGFRLAAAIEPNPARRAAFQAHWGVEAAFADFESWAASGRRADVVSVCAPTQHHADILDRLIALRPRAVFCEKPLAHAAAESRRLAAAYKRASIPLAVGYLRRWDQSMQALRAELPRWGALRNATAHYSKGILHYGCHLLDLLGWLLGPLSPREVSKSIWDHGPQDPTLDATLITADGAPIRLVGCDSRDFDQFELRLTCAGGVIDIEDFGRRIRRRRARRSPAFPDHVLLEDAPFVATGLDQALLAAVRNLRDAALDGATLKADGYSAADAEALCEALRARAPTT
jgi:predicted dehydrogenase